MAYNIKINTIAARQLDKIDKKQTARILLAIIQKLSKHPENYEYLSGKFKEYRKFRVGDYRVFFKIIDEDVVVYKVRHRREAYE